jgi:hypothetical protein
MLSAHTWISAKCALRQPMLVLRIWVCASTRMVVQCFLSASSSASMFFEPSVHFLTYLLKACQQVCSTVCRPQQEAVLAEHLQLGSHNLYAAHASLRANMQALCKCALR